MANRLVGQTESIAHTAISGAGQRPERGLLKGHSFFAENKLQMLGNALWAEVFKIKLQAARQHGDGQFLRVCGGKQKLNVGRRLFQGF